MNRRRKSDIAAIRPALQARALRAEVFVASGTMAGLTISLADAIARGENATTVSLDGSHHVLDGGAGAGRIIGSDARDVICVGADDDTIAGGAGTRNEHCHSFGAAAADTLNIATNSTAYSACSLSATDEFATRKQVANNTDWRIAA